MYARVFQEIFLESVQNCPRSRFCLQSLLTLCYCRVSEMLQHISKDFEQSARCEEKQSKKSLLPSIAALNSLGVARVVEERGGANAMSLLNAEHRSQMRPALFSEPRTSSSHPFFFLSIFVLLSSLPSISYPTSLKARLKRAKTFVHSVFSNASSVPGRRLATKTIYVHPFAR